MTKSALSPFGGNSSPVAILLMLTVPAALLIGLYGRFKGLGSWPLGVDEFYMSRSIDHVLSNGLPRFPCGGYYTRGVAFQYLAAALRLQGLSPELAARLLAAVSSLAVLPAAFLLARRIQGSTAGWLCVVILCLSVWEIEMARFGRMYSPFQAVFCCYLLFYLRYSVDEDAAAFGWMIALSVLGVLTWEGGTFLGLATLLAVVQRQHCGRPSAAGWMRLAATLAVLLILYAATRDLRGASGTAADAAAPAADATTYLLAGWRDSIAAHRIWACVFVVPVAVGLWAVRFIWQFRSRALVFAALVIVLIAALGHAFTAAAGVLGLLLLTGLLDSSELRYSYARPLWIAMLAAAVFWSAFEAAGGGSFQHLIDVPDVFQRIGHPWGRAMPLLSVALACGAAFWAVQWIKQPDAAPRAIQPLLALLLMLILAVGAIPTERIETRYTFFLFPLLVALAVTALLHGAQRARGGARGAALLAAAPLVCFAFTEDLQLRHVVHIDSAAENYRVGMKSARADHYYPRNDMRGIAAWLDANVRPGDLVVSGIPNLDQYYPRFDYFYLEEADNRYDAYLCGDGRTDRWTNHRVMSQAGELKGPLESGRRVYATVYSDTEQRLRGDARALGWTVTRVYTAIDAKSTVLAIAPRASAAAESQP